MRAFTTPREKTFEEKVLQEFERIEGDYFSRMNAATDDGLRKESKELYRRAKRDKEDMLRVIDTNALLKEAWRYYVARPEYPAEGEDNEFWMRCENISFFYLTAGGIAKVVRDTDEAKKRSRDAWATWVGVTTGLVTALVALFSIILSLVIFLSRS